METILRFVISLLTILDNILRWHYRKCDNRLREHCIKKYRKEGKL